MAAMVDAAANTTMEFGSFVKKVRIVDDGNSPERRSILCIMTTAVIAMMAISNVWVMGCCQPAWCEGIV